MMKWLKKKPEELKCGEALVYMGLLGIAMFVPFLIITNFDEIKDWIKRGKAKKSEQED